MIAQCLGCGGAISPDDAAYSKTAARCCSSGCVVTALDRLRELEPLAGRHQVAPMAVACGIDPGSTIDELYARMAHMRMAEQRLSAHECIDHPEPKFGECDTCDEHNPEPPEGNPPWQ